MLVVDGHAAVRAALPPAFGAFGCETATARDGEDALRHVRDTKRAAADGDRPAPFRLVVMDLVLPRTDGLRLLGQLWNEFPNVPAVVVLGSLQDPGAIREVLDLGATDYIPKPFDLDVLLYKVCVLLGEPTPALFHWAPLRARTLVRSASEFSRSLRLCIAALPSPMRIPRPPIRPD